MDAREMLNLPTKYKHIINMRITNAHEMYVQLTSPSMHYGDRIGSPGNRNNTGFVSGLDRIDAYNEKTEKLKAEYVAVNHKISKHKEKPLPNTTIHKDRFRESVMPELNIWMKS